MSLTLRWLLLSSGQLTNICHSRENKGLCTVLTEIGVVIKKNSMKISQKN